MNKLRIETVTRYVLFDRYALNDQRWYYNDVVKRHNKALRAVNFVRASLALLTGVAAGLAAVVQQSYFVGNGSCSVENIATFEAFNTPCDAYKFVILTCVVLSIALPAAGAFFNSLVDLYQWDRLVQVYESAVENINVADALSPDEGQNDPSYAQSYNDYVKGTLQVMSDETAQWGQSIRAPRATEQFLKEARARAEEKNADADAARYAANNPPLPPETG